MSFARLVILTGVAAVCLGSSAATQQEVEAERWDAFVKAFIQSYFEFNPDQAINAGRHEFDGQLPDYSRAGLAREGAWLHQSVATVRAFHSESLDEHRRFEQALVLAQLEEWLFWLEDAQGPFKNPGYYSMIGEVSSVYLSREYAPLEQRMKAITKHAESVVRAADQIRANLEPPLPRSYVKLGRTIYGGLVSFFRDDVPLVFASVEDEELQARFHRSNVAAVAALDSLDAWFAEMEDSATDDYSLGADLFSKMLRQTTGVDIPLDRLKAIGEADLERNLSALREACKALDPDKSVEECIAIAQANKPSEGPVEAAAGQLAELKAFLLKNPLVSIPGNDDAKVVETPSFLRYNYAFLRTPGPYEASLPSFYYITPPDPSWPLEEQKAYVLDVGSLLATSVHEVWPGHFLQYLHGSRVTSEFGRLVWNYAAGEGWAHYTEELMMEAGLRGGDLATRIGFLLQALLRDVRFLCAIGLHTEGMTIEQAETMFREKAYADPGNARQQAARGTYDPQYLNYTLGKLMILKLRDDWCTSRGGRDAWLDFHDTFLSYGIAPIPLIRAFMLGSDAGPGL